jgi:uncharacterized membrane protein YphA (DoxX/SURF4 family)
LALGIRSFRLNSLFFWLAKTLLAGLFIYAGFYKFANQDLFVSAMSSYPILNPFLKTLRYLIPSFEIILGIMLLLKGLERYAALGLGILLTAFIALAVYNNLIGMNKECGCFPPSFILSSKDPIFILARDMFLLLTCIFVTTTTLRVKSRPLFTKERPALFVFASFLMVALSASIFFNDGHLKGRPTRESGNDMQSKEATTQGFIGRRMPHLVLRGQNGLVTTSDELFREPYLVLIMNSLECGPCKTEATYFERLSREFGAAFRYCAMVRPIGWTAIATYKDENELTFGFYENLNSTSLSQGVLSSSSMIVAISSNGTILTVFHDSNDMQARQRGFEKQLSALIDKKAF